MIPIGRPSGGSTRWKSSLTLSWLTTSAGKNTTSASTAGSSSRRVTQRTSRMPKTSIRPSGPTSTTSCSLWPTRACSCTKRIHSSAPCTARAWTGGTRAYGETRARFSTSPTPCAPARTPSQRRRFSTSATPRLIWCAGESTTPGGRISAWSASRNWSRCKQIGCCHPANAA